MSDRVAEESVFHVVEFNRACPAPQNLDLDGLLLRNTFHVGTFGMLLVPAAGASEAGLVAVKCAKESDTRPFSASGDDLSARFHSGKDEDRAWAMFRQEYEALEKVDGTCAPAVYALGYVATSRDDGLEEVRPAIAMEMLGEGWMSLDAAVTRGALYGDGSLRARLRACARVGLMLAHAVGILREKQVLHHDISSNNVFVHLSGDPVTVDDLRLIDFGQAAHVDGTVTPNRWGTPSYAAPEMIPFERCASALSRSTLDILRASKNHKGSDIWPVGAALYHVRTGKQPSCGPDRGDYAAEIQIKLFGLELLHDSGCDGDEGLERADEQLRRVIAQCTLARASLRPTPDEIEEDLSRLEEVLDSAGGRHESRSIRGRSRRVLAEGPAPDRWEAGAIPITSTDVFAAIYRVAGMKGRPRRVLAIGASDEGCALEEVRINGTWYPVWRERLVKIPDDGWDYGSCPWTDIERAYVREQILPTSMRGWFSGCSSLEFVPGSELINTCWVKSLRACFDGCSSLESLDVSGWDTSFVENMAGCFSGCSSLEFLDVSGWDVSSVADMRLCFDGCSSLGSLDVSGWDVSSVEKMGFCFHNCSSLESLDVSGWDVSSVADMTGCFFGCSSLELLDVSGWDVSSVESMRFCFDGCSALEALDVSGWDVSSVTDMEGCFYDCSALRSLDVSGWDVSSVEDLRACFQGCSALESIDVSGWDVSSVEDMRSCFQGCSSLGSLDISGWNITSRDARVELGVDPTVTLVGALDDNA